MGSVLPLYATSAKEDSSYDNAKVRRRSACKVLTQAGLENVARKGYISCSVGKFLGLVLLLGIAYVTVTHTTPLHVAKTVGSRENGRLGVVDGVDAWRMSVEDGSLNEGLKVHPSNKSTSFAMGTTGEIADQLPMEEVLWRHRQMDVVKAFKHAWKGYKDYAMGYDELKPVERKGVDGLGGLGATIVDALDTAIIMGCDDIVKEGAAWIERELPKRLRETGQVNLFETTIRVLGGLLSAFHLLGKEPAITSKMSTKPKVLLDTAIDLADRLYAGFSGSPTAIPFSDIDLSASEAHPSSTDNGDSSTSEISTLQMEFWYLSQLSGDPRYGTAAMEVFEHIKGLQKEQGLVPIYISPHTGQFSGNNIRLGSRGDSYYEYLLKVWLQQGGADNGGSRVTFLKEMYDEAMTGVSNLLVRKSLPNGLVYVGELPYGVHGSFSPKMDHLVCFLAGTLALGATRGLPKQQALRRGFMNEKDLLDLKLAEDLCHTCYQMYAVTATGLAPEIAYFNTDGNVQSGMDGGRKDAKYKDDILIHALDKHNLLRPETVESLFVLYRVTGEKKYREWGWNIFQAFETYTKVATGGYSSLSSVTQIPPPKRDKMETFFLGETLKYLYLLFSDHSVLPLDEYVFNSEAHPFPVILEKLHIKRQSGALSGIKIDPS